MLPSRPVDVRKAGEVNKEAGRHSSRHREEQWTIFAPPPKQRLKKNFQEHANGLAERSAVKSIQVRLVDCDES